MRRLVLIVAALLTACASPSTSGTAAASKASSLPPAASRSSSPQSRSSAGQSAYGVFVDEKLSTYSVLLVGTDGKLVAKADANVPAVYRFTHFPPAPPLLSVSSSRVYYADGNSIKYVKPDGSTGVVMSYPGGPQTAAGFAVSPDDRQIAVALLAFRNPDNFQASLDLYVEDLGGGNKVDLFSSTSIAEWPIAWSNGHLVLAVGPSVAGNASSNPYNGFEGYHIVDASTGNRLVTMSTDCLFGPLQPTGSACSSGPQVMAQALDGTTRVFSPSAGSQLFLAMSPDGSRIAGRPGALGSPMVLFNSVGTTTSLARSGVPMGWIDNQRLVFYGPNDFERNILDVAADSLIPIPACPCGNPGIFFGTLATSG